MFIGDTIRLILFTENLISKQKNIYICTVITKVLILEDDLATQETLAGIVANRFPNFQIIGITAKISEAKSFIENDAPDIVISDIEVEDGLSFDLYEQLNEINFKLIFVTGFNQYALQAFQLCAIDYILKPFDEDDLVEALARTSKYLEGEQISVQLQLLKEQLNDTKPKRMIFRTSDQIKMVDLDKIIQLKASGSYTEVLIKDEPKLLVSKNLKEYESIIPQDSFFRSHQSHLINLNHFDHFQKKDGGYIVMNDGSSAPLSARKKNEFFQILENLG